jgi:integrase
MAMFELLKRMGRTVTVHGFRSSFRDWAAECTDFPDWIAEMALAHANGDKVEAAYRRGNASFLALCRADKDIRQFLADDELVALFDMSYHTKHVDTIFRRVFG